MTGKVRWIFKYLICFCFIKYKIIDIINKMYYTAYIDKDLQSNFGACLKFCASVEFDEKYTSDLQNSTFLEFISAKVKRTGWF